MIKKKPDTKDYCMQIMDTLKSPTRGNDFFRRCRLMIVTTLTE